MATAANSTNRLPGPVLTRLEGGVKAVFGTCDGVVG
jgi:hypothetical protein